MIKEFALSLVLPPSRLRVLGVLLCRLGFAMTVLGSFLHIGLKAITLLQSMSRGEPASIGIESIIPGLPTWFIPESAEGFALWVTVTALGLYCQYLAKEFKRIYSWNT